MYSPPTFLTPEVLAEVLAESSWPAPYTLEDDPAPAMLDHFLAHIDRMRSTSISTLRAKQGASERQFRDVVGILRVRGDALDREYIARWVAVLGLEEQWERARDLETGPR